MAGGTGRSDPYIDRALSICYSCGRGPLAPVQYDAVPEASMLTTSELTWLRGAVLLAITGCAGGVAPGDAPSTERKGSPKGDPAHPAEPADTGTDSCAELEEYTVDHPEYPWGDAHDVMVCIDPPGSVTGFGCRTVAAGASSGGYGKQAELVRMAVGEHPARATSYTFWYADLACGPIESIEDRCCYAMDLVSSESWAIGRPYVVDGRARAAAVGPRQGWATLPHPELGGDLTEDERRRLARWWAARAQDEHAAVAALASFVLELLAVGAPAALVERAATAAADEVRHAKAAFSIASALAGGPLGAGPLDVQPAGRRPVVLAEMVVATIAEGCINETVGAAIAQEQLNHATHPTIRAALDEVVKDETEHAALAWAFVAWALEVDPSLADVVRDAFDDWPADPDTGPAAAPAYGVLSRETVAATAERVRRHVIKPGAEALLAHVAAA